MESKSVSRHGRLFRSVCPSGCLTALRRCPLISSFECPLALDLMAALNIVSKFSHLIGSPSNIGTSMCKDELCPVGWDGSEGTGVGVDVT